MTHIINGKEWEERVFNDIGYGSVSHIFAIFPNEEALVLVRRKDDMKEDKPDYNNIDEWCCVHKVVADDNNMVSSFTFPVSNGWEYRVLAHPPTNQNPMPEIKPGDGVYVDGCGWRGVYEVRKDWVSYFHTDRSGIPEIESMPHTELTKIHRPGEGVIWERGSK